MDLAYCNDCDDLVPFTISDEIVEEEFHSANIKYSFSVGKCLICGSEVSTDLDYNYRKSDAKWKAFRKIVKICPNCNSLLIVCYDRGNPKPFYCCPMCGYETKKQ